MEVTEEEVILVSSKSKIDEDTNEMSTSDNDVQSDTENEHENSTVVEMPSAKRSRQKPSLSKLETHGIFTIKSYSPNEDREILQGIIKENGYINTKSNTLYMKILQNSTGLKGRTWSGLRERFRKRIYPKILHHISVWKPYLGFSIPELRKFKDDCPPEYISKPFCMATDMAILSIIVAHKDSASDFKSTAFWKNILEELPEDNPLFGMNPSVIRNCVLQFRGRNLGRLEERFTKADFETLTKVLKLKTQNTSLRQQKAPRSRSCSGTDSDDSTHTIPAPEIENETCRQSSASNTNGLLVNKIYPTYTVPSGSEDEMESDTNTGNIVSENNHTLDSEENENSQPASTYSDIGNGSSLTKDDSTQEKSIADESNLKVIKCTCKKLVLEIPQYGEDNSDSMVTEAMDFVSGLFDNSTTVAHKNLVNLLFKQMTLLKADLNYLISTHK